MVATSVNSVPNPSGSLMLIGLILGAIRRKQAIGGWLFFFWQVAAGCAVTFAYTDWSEYAPRAWHDSLKYFAFMAGAGPRMVVLPAIAVLGVTVLRTREWRWLVALRYALILFVLLGALCVAVDLRFFPDRTFVDVAALIFPGVYAVYFFVSMRVRGVFREHVWPA